MKTKNNVQKAIILKTAAVIVSFVLISFTVSAQDFWKNLLTNSGFNEIAIAMVNVSENGNNENNLFIETYAMEPLSDSELELENWMTNETNFTSTLFQTETEVVTSLEDWMLNEDLFNNTNVEKSLVLEDWMTNAENWEI